MDFKLNREICTASEVVQDSSCEQAVELDYILPDYFPDIFRVLKCRIMPRIVSHSINGEKLTFELVAVIKLTYLSEGSDKLNCIEQKLSFSKSCDIPAGLKLPMLNVNPKTDYVNCRVVNQRRLDIRGAVTTRVRIVGEKAHSLVCDAFGGNIQLKKEAVTYPTKRINVTKRVTVIEELEISSSKPTVSSVVRSDCVAVMTEQKIMTNKLITKGEATVNLLYTAEDDGKSTVETMKFAVPFSQIIDADGVDDRFECYVDISASSCETIVKGEPSDRIIECEIVLVVSCMAVRFETNEIVTDAYSTKFECDIEKNDKKIETVPVVINESHTQQATLTCHDSEISTVCDAWCNVSSVSGRFSYEQGKLIVVGNINFCVVAKNTGGCPVWLETDAAFEHPIDTECVCEDSCIEPKVCVSGCSYNLVGNNAVEVRAELKIGGYLYKLCCKKLVTDIKIDTDKPSECDRSYALKLCFADRNESVWDIAKKYRTSVTAVLTENELVEEILSDDKMLLIPNFD